MEGKIFGSYRIVRILGEGGMGAVYEAISVTGDRQVAIKLLHRRYSQDPQIAARFLNEAKACSRIGHPGVVAVYEFGQSPEGAYMVMEYLRGETMRARLARVGAMGMAGVRPMAQLAETLAASHEHAVVHRDVKPENAMLIGQPGDEQIRLLDFGVARVTGPDAASATKTGMMLGTPAYMAPEQCRGLRVDDRADVYSAGVMLYEVLSGRQPFVGDLAELMTQHLYAPMPPLPGLPPELGDLVRRMLAKTAEERPPMAQIARELRWIERAAVALWGRDGLSPALQSGPDAMTMAVGRISPQDLQGLQAPVGAPLSGAQYLATVSQQFMRPPPQQPAQGPQEGAPAQSISTLGQGSGQRLSRIQQGPSQGRQRLAVIVSAAVVAALGGVAIVAWPARDARQEAGIEASQQGAASRESGALQATSPAAQPGEVAAQGPDMGVAAAPAAGDLQKRPVKPSARIRKTVAHKQVTDDDVPIFKLK